jgi:V-type H+-transporting ATPase subunit d
MVDMTFNVNCGYLDGLVRGFRAGILKSADYVNLSLCETLEDLKLHLQSTDYGTFLANEPSPLSVSVIDERLREKLVNEFEHVRQQAVEPLKSFLDYITYGYMIDNIVLVITGVLHNRPVRELLPKCHKLGNFPQLELIHIANSAADLYNAILVDTPLAPYFLGCISEGDFDEMNIEIIRNTLYKAYLEDFYQFCERIGGATAESMCQLLEFEADRRAFIITINSFGTELTKDDRATLYPKCGKLHPYGLSALARCDDYDQVRAVAAYYLEYNACFESAGTGPGEKTLEDKFFEYEVALNRNSFMYHFNYGIFYSFIKLKEQENRNVIWIAECIAQKHKAKIDNYVNIF